MLSAAAALLPVIGLLAALFFMDSFKLVPPRGIALALLAGTAAAVVSFWLWPSLVVSGMSSAAASRYLAPILEETLKASIIVVLLVRGRAGFLVDAAVLGFSVGTGFALVENVLYLRALPHGTLALWLVRGFGTAMLHGGTTSIFAILARMLTDRYVRQPHLAFLPPFVAAVAIHSAFNHLPLPPAGLTAVIMVVLPLLLVAVFDRSERATREWMGAGMDLDIEVLQLVASEHFAFTRFGQYLQELRSRFPAIVVADMYCLLRLELELSVQARAFVMAREAGLELRADDDLAASFAEREYLQHSIGRTGLLALRPLQVTNVRDRFHRHLLARSKDRAPRKGL
jgi:RsiW-degrading membrane proteinase PrsW (M82 family)